MVLFKKKTPKEYILYSVIIALGIFLFVPGIVAPKELFVPMIAGAFAIVFGISAVIPRKTNAEKFIFQALFCFFVGIDLEFTGKNGRGGGSRTPDILLPKQAR